MRRLRAKVSNQISALSKRHDDFVRFGNVALPQNDVQIFEFAECDVAIGLSSEDRTFIRYGGNVLGLEEAQNVEELGG